MKYELSFQRRGH